MRCDNLSLLIELFFEGSESDLSLEFDDFRVSFNSATRCSRFYFMGLSVAFYKLSNSVFIARPISFRITSDESSSFDSFDDYSNCCIMIYVLFAEYNKRKDSRFIEPTTSIK